MAKILCLCDEVISTSMGPCPHEYYLLLAEDRRAFSEACDRFEAGSVTTKILRCPSCDVLWVYWERGWRIPGTPYAPVETPQQQSEPARPAHECSGASHGAEGRDAAQGHVFLADCDFEEELGPAELLEAHARPARRCRDCHTLWMSWDGPEGPEVEYRLVGDPPPSPEELEAERKRLGIQRIPRFPCVCGKEFALGGIPPPFALSLIAEGEIEASETVHDFVRALIRASRFYSCPHCGVLWHFLDVAKRRALPYLRCDGERLQEAGERASRIACACGADLTAETEHGSPAFRLMTEAASNDVVEGWAPGLALARSTPVLRCPACPLLWVFWEGREAPAKAYRRQGEAPPSWGSPDATGEVP